MLTDARGVPMGSLFQGLQYTEIDISAAQLLNIGASPIPLLAQSPAGTYHEPIKWIVEYTHNGIVYNIAGIDYFNIEEVSSSNITRIETGMFTMGINNVTIANPYGLNVAVGLVVSNITVPLQTEYRLWTDSGLSPTLGNGTLKIKCWYIIRQFG